MKGVDEVWPEAKVPAVSKEEERRLCRMHASADWAYDHVLDVLDGPQNDAKERLMRGRGYLCESFSFSLFWLGDWGLRGREKKLITDC